MDYGVPLGHRFRALKLWFVMRYFGRERIEAMLRSHIQWAKDFRRAGGRASEVRARGSSAAVSCLLPL